MTEFSVDRQFPTTILWEHPFEIGLAFLDLLMGWELSAFNLQRV